MPSVSVQTTGTKPLLLVGALEAVPEEAGVLVAGAIKLEPALLADDEGTLPFEEGALLPEEGG